MLTIIPVWLSLLLPGTGQYAQGRVTDGIPYSAVAAGGLAAWWYWHDPSVTTSEIIFGDHPRSRASLLGYLAYQGSGGLSFYDAFRYRASLEEYQGDYVFLPQEPVRNVLAAPFRFAYLSSPRTLAPLGLALGLVLLSRNGSGVPLRLTGGDIVFRSAISYNAGVHEEAVFRGGIQPMLRSVTGSGLLANLGTSALFAAAHLPQNPAPWPQLILGAYLGWLTESNHWAIGESVFLHSWWDVVVLMGAQAATSKGEGGLGPSIVHLPPVSWIF